jgi:hypothetical protein
MTFEELRERARRLARVSASSAPDEHINRLINDGMRRFARDVGGLPKRDYYSIAAHFDLQTDFAFHLTITGSSNNDIDTDIAVTDADAYAQTGAQVATELQAQIRAAIGVGADLTVAWSNFAFTIDTIDGDTIAITEPDDSTTYTNYVEELFGSEQSVSDTSVECGFPEDCTVYVDLDGELMRVNSVEWDKSPLCEVGMSDVLSPEVSGTPAFYAWEYNRLFLTPVPTSQDKFLVDYVYVPDEVDTTVADPEIVDDVPEKYQIGIAYYVSSRLLEEMFEGNIAKERYAEYFRYVTMFKKDRFSTYIPGSKRKSYVRFEVVDGT